MRSGDASLTCERMVLETPVTRRLALRLKHEILQTPFEPAAIFAATRLVPWLRSGLDHSPSLLTFESLHIERAIGRILTPAMTCIDVGAHIGRYLSTFTRLAPQGAHIAVEPTPWKAAWLKQKFKSAKIVAAALADTSGTQQFVEDVNAPAFSKLHLVANGKYLSEDPRSLKRYEVPVETLDAVTVGLSKIGLIKLDVEGAEHLVLQGGAETIARNRPAILFEAGAVASRHAQEGSSESAYTFLTEKLGYKVQTPLQFLISHNALTFEQFVGARSYPFTALNFIATPDELVSLRQPLRRQSQIRPLAENPATP